MPRSVRRAGQYADGTTVEAKMGRTRAALGAWGGCTYCRFLLGVEVGEEERKGRRRNASSHAISAPLRSA